MKKDWNPEFPEASHVKINILNLRPWVYFIECKNDSGLQIVKKIVKI